MTEGKKRIKPLLPPATTTATKNRDATGVMELKQETKTEWPRREEAINS